MLQSVIDKIRNYPWMAATGAAIAGFLLIWQTCLQLGLFDGKQPLACFRLHFSPQLLRHYVGGRLPACSRY